MISLAIKSSLYQLFQPFRLTMQSIPRVGEEMEIKIEDEYKNFSVSRVTYRIDMDTSREYDIIVYIEVAK